MSIASLILTQSHLLDGKSRCQSLNLAHFIVYVSKKGKWMPPEGQEKLMVIICSNLNIKLVHKR